VIVTFVRLGTTIVLFSESSCVPSSRARNPAFECRQPLLESVHALPSKATRAETEQVVGRELPVAGRVASAQQTAADDSDRKCDVTDGFLGGRDHRSIARRFDRAVRRLALW
jgi:hypothetical protein